MATEQEEINRLRLELANMEALKHEAERNAAQLEGQLNEGQNADIGRLRQQSVEACVALQARIDEIEELKKKLAEAERIAAEQGARVNNQLADMRATFEVKANELNELTKKLAEAERIAAEQGTHANSQLAAVQAAVEAKVRELEELKKKLADVEQFATEGKAALGAADVVIDGLRQSNADLNAALKRPVNVNLSSRKSMVWAIAGGAALVLLIMVAGIKVLSHQSDGVDAITGAVSAAMSKSKPETKPAVPALVVSKAEPPVVPSIQSPTPSHSRSCPYASLNACVDDMAKRVGGVPSEFIQSRGAYWCQRVGCN